MPFDVQPALGEQPAADTSQPAPPSVFSPHMDWLAKQPYSGDNAEFQTGNFAPGHTLGGPAMDTQALLADPRKYAVFKPAPVLTDQVATQAKAFGKFGNVTVDMVDPFTTGDSILQGAGVNQQQADDVIGKGQAFLSERDISFSNAPVRLFDYATSLLKAITDEAGGKPIVVPMPTGAGDLKYNFQRDPGYWAILAKSDEGQLKTLADSVASQYTSDANSYLRDSLLTQFKADQQISLGLSSGDPNTDYQAKLAFQTDYITERTGGRPVGAAPIPRPTRGGGHVSSAVGFEFSLAALPAALAQFPAAIVQAIPFVGGDVARAAYSPPKVINDAWAQLTPDQRKSYFANAGTAMTLGNVAFWLPALGGMGAVEAVAARSSGVAAKALQGYTALRNLTAATMATGVVVLTANAGLELAVPGYAEGFGRRIDYARPWSSSPMAGLINNLGFFSSGTFGAALAARTAAKVGGRLLSPVGGSLAGHLEIPMYADGMGGARVTSQLATAGLDPGILEAAPKATFHSVLENTLEKWRRQMWDGALQGHPTGDAAIDAMDYESKLAAANADLARNAYGDASTAELIKAMVQARRPRPLFDGKAQAAHDTMTEVAGITNQSVRDQLMDRYGPAYMTRRAGAYTAPALEAEARATVTRLGGNGDLLPGHGLVPTVARTADDWAQVIRHLDAYEYMKNNGELHAAIEGPPVSEEGAKLMLMRSDHLFAGDVDRLVAATKGEDAAAAQAAVAAAIRRHPEAADWFANEWQPKAGVTRTPENVPPAAFADWLEEIRGALPSRRALPAAGSPSESLPINAFHAKVEADGHYTLGFKPTDAEGNFISYVRRPSGATFKSPWIDYPLGNIESIDLGARRLLASKLDGVFRGIRTRQILEFQKALLFRRLSGKYDIAAEQIDRFHAGVLQLASEHQLQPQSVGAIGRGSVIGGYAGLRKDIDKLAEDVFGAGPLRTRDGKLAAVNWADEIAKSYRQSLKLNLTAGLMSHMKANFGEIGSAMAWLSDPAYMTWRFNLVPLFKGGELWESVQYNYMEGVRGVDANTRALYQRVGIGNDYAAINAERPFDPMLTSMTAKNAGRDLSEGSTAAGRAARAYSFYARKLPEDMPLKVATATAQAQAAETVATHGGGNLPSPEWLPVRPPDGPVVTPDTIPDTHTTLLGDIRPDLLSADQLGEDQGFWHTTTALNKVYEHGLLARTEIPGHVLRPELPRIGEGFNDWRARLHDAAAKGSPIPEDLAAPADAKTNATSHGAYLPVYVRVDDVELRPQGKTAAPYAAPEHIEEIRPAGQNGEFQLTQNPDALANAKGGTILEVNRAQVYDLTNNLTSDMIPGDAIARVWRWDAKTGQHVLDHEIRDNLFNDRVGLGGGAGYRVSTTYREDHALEISRRLKFASQAARSEVSHSDILDHFAPLYGDDYYSMGRVLGANPRFDDAGQLVLSGGKLPDGAINDHDALVAWMDARYKGTTPARGRDKFSDVQNLDSSLHNWQLQDEGEFTGAVILAGDWSDYARIDPAEVGTVRLAVRKGAIARDGADQFELEFPSADLKVIDDRHVLEPLASDGEGLMRQLHETLAAQPKTGQLSVADYMVGGNGIAPGLETRARQIITKLQDLQEAELDGGPTFVWDNLTPIERVGMEAKLAEQGWQPLDKAISEAYAKGDIERGQELQRLAGGSAESGGAVRTGPATELPYARTRLDGSVEAKPIAQLYDEFQRRAGSADDLASMAGTPEALFENLLPREAEADIAKGGLPPGLAKAIRTFVNPTQYKVGKLTDLQINWLRQRWPSLLEGAGMTGPAEVLGGILKVPRNRWLDFTIRDRELLGDWIAKGTPEAEQALLDHAGGNAAARAALDAFETSEDWAAISTLVRVHLQALHQEAFGVHFFQSYRSPLERSINHPLLGVYPASWALKTAKQWARFLYDNETLGIKIGMTPAQAISQLVHSQNAALAQADVTDKTNPLSITGPLGSPMLILNLLLPGDWSSIPFPASRTIRDYARPLLANGTMPKASDVIADNIQRIGLTRDLRLFAESAGQIADVLRGPQSKVKATHAAAIYSVRDGVPPTYEEPLR